MNNLMVDRSADAGREWSSIRIGESKEGGNGTMVTDESVCNRIQLFGRDTRLYHFRKLCQCLPNKQVRLPQEFYLFVCLKIYHLI